MYSNGSSSNGSSGSNLSSSSERGNGSSSTHINSSDSRVAIAVVVGRSVSFHFNLQRNRSIILISFYLSSYLPSFLSLLSSSR